MDPGESSMKQRSPIPTDSEEELMSSVEDVSPLDSVMNDASVPRKRFEIKKVSFDIERRDSTKRE